MDYRGGLNAMYNNPSWLAQTSLIGLCGLIPFVGQIVIMGYAFEAAAYLHKTNRDTFPDFNFNRFGPYLARGVGPFLVALIFMFIHVPVYIAEALGLGLVGGLLVEVVSSIDPSNSGLRLGTLLTVGFFNMAVIGIVHTMINIFQFALMLRGGLSGEFAESFRFSFCSEYAKRAGGATFTATIFLGYLMFCLYCFVLGGIWSLGLFILPAMGIYTLACAWIACQLYREYLTEKGAPFRVKCEIIDE
jgi:hypothetical protein